MLGFVGRDFMIHNKLGLYVAMGVVKKKTLQNQTRKTQA